MERKKNQKKKAVYLKRSKAAAAILQINFYISYWSARATFFWHFVSTSAKDTNPHI